MTVKDVSVEDAYNWLVTARDECIRAVHNVYNQDYVEAEARVLRAYEHLKDVHQVLREVVDG